MMNRTMSSLLMPMLSPKAYNARLVSESHLRNGLLNLAGNIASAKMTDIASIAMMTDFILRPDSRIASHTFLREEEAR